MDSYFQRNRSALADHRGCQGLTEPREVRPDLDRFSMPARLELLLHGGNRHDALIGILKMQPRLFRAYRPGFEEKDARDDLQTVCDTVQQQLQSRGQGEPIEIGPYLSRLCETLAASMIGERRPISLKVRVQGGTASSSQAVSIGLMVTELVINAIKHAFPGDHRVGTVVVAYDLAEPNWTLTVSDNGIGRPQGRSDDPNPGLGTTIIEALAKQLDAHAEIVMNPHGTTVSITHAPFSPQLPTAA